MKMIYPGQNVPEQEEFRTLVVPSGIGEFQWLWAKMENTHEDFVILGLDGAPRRLHQFAELHPRVRAFGYCTFDYSQIRNFQKFHDLTSWEKIKSKFGPGQTAFLACNPHLESGAPLSSWLPDLETTYSYPYVLNNTHRAEAKRLLDGTWEEDDVVIGISCASYRGAEAWKTWNAREWTDFLTCVQAYIPKARFALLGGAWDDLTSAVYDPDGPLRWLLDSRGLPPVGTTSFGGTVGFLENIDGYIGFSSGLGHVAHHLCGVPTFMLWPEHEIELLSKTWVNPQSLEKGTYVPSAWDSPATVFTRAIPWLDRLTAR